MPGLTVTSLDLVLVAFQTSSAAGVMQVANSEERTATSPHGRPLKLMLSVSLALKGAKW
jgi:hypothetical protein